MSEPLTREELLVELVQIYEDGLKSHTDAVNGLSELLAAEAEKEPHEPWAQGFAEVEAEADERGW